MTVIPYILPGGMNTSLRDVFQLFQQYEVPVVEIGIPMSDPIADGSTIERAGERALQQGVTLQTIAKELSRIPLHETRIAMLYTNTLLQYGLHDFVRWMHIGHITSVIIPDLPLEEQTYIRTYLQRHDIHFVQLVPLTASTERMKILASRSSPFVYAVTQNGTTGKRKRDETFVEQIKQLKQFTNGPIYAGFGIQTKEDKAYYLQYADGVIIGSAFIRAFQENDQEKLKELLT